MKTVSNIEHLQQIDTEEAAVAVLNLGIEPCTYCPRDREKRCDGKCVCGLAEWLIKSYDPEEDVWKEW